MRQLLYWNPHVELHSQEALLDKKISDVSKRHETEVESFLLLPMYMHNYSPILMSWNQNFYILHALQNEMFRVKKKKKKVKESSFKIELRQYTMS